MARQPWNTGNPDQDWIGYFLPGSEGVLRNRVGATSAEELSVAETDLSEARLLELREKPRLATPRTYDLAHMSAIHKQLFQDVYDWAGEVRTVGIEKDGESFCPPGNISQAMQHVATRIAETDSLRDVAESALAQQVAYLYDYVNYAHPFRECNGRSTRELFDQLLAERSRGLDWERTDSAELYRACHSARADSDLRGLELMFERIIDRHPAYDF
ncbi:Fic family protein [Gordonia sp. CPCC 206044]|uniref:Fic/DOC family protein n=1 Tax=Gordonia sp. CPCC 206044 TaxID=3140793 RepID=UPI003AF3607F